MVNLTFPYESVIIFVYQNLLYMMNLVCFFVFISLQYCGMTTPLTDQFTNSNGHIINWYVHRNKDIRMTLQSLWGNPSKKFDKHSMKNATVEQRIVQRTNILFRNMETHGPSRSEFQNFQYDSEKKMYHAHVWSSKRLTMVVMWEISEQDKIINIVRMGYHEGFVYKRTHKIKDAIEKAKQVRDNDPMYLANLDYQKKRKALENSKDVSAGKFT